MPIFIKTIDPLSEYQARLASVEDLSPNSYRCTHPRGAARCQWLVQCSACPFADVLELDIAA